MRPTVFFNGAPVIWRRLFKFRVYTRSCHNRCSEQIVSVSQVVGQRHGLPRGDVEHCVYIIRLEELLCSCEQSHVLYTGASVLGPRALDGSCADFVQLSLPKASRLDLVLLRGVVGLAAASQSQFGKAELGICGDPDQDGRARSTCYCTWLWRG